MFSLSLIRKKQSFAKADAQTLYEEIIRQARLPLFYLKGGVPDTVDGRFELIILHTVLMTYALMEMGHEGQKTAQALFDRVFKDMDVAIREIGVGDLSVGKHMRRMTSGYNGRLRAYEPALPEKADKTLLMASLSRNLYGTVLEKDEGRISQLADYMMANAKMLMTQKIHIEDWRFLPPEDFLEKGSE